MKEKRHIEQSQIALIAPVAVILDELIVLKDKLRHITFFKSLSGHLFIQFGQCQTRNYLGHHLYVLNRGSGRDIYREKVETKQEKCWLAII